jgi:pimeloyl-ACP methyl ester carboxylesterase
MMTLDTTAFKDLYPFEGKTLDVGGARLHYLDEGQGPPVVMLHGNPSWSFYYRDLAKALAPTHRVIVPDHIGCGLSDKPADDVYEYTLKRRVDDLDQLMDHLALPQKITLVVHDWGGMIGLAWASRHPERIEKLVVMNTAAFFLPANKSFPLALRICRDSLLGTVLVRGANAFSVAASFVGCKQHPMSARVRAAYQAPYDSWDNRVATLRFVQDIPLDPRDKSYSVVAEVEAGLERFKQVPMLLLWGEQDFVFDKHFLAEWQRRFPDATVKSFPDAGHYVLEDVASEAIPTIKAFIERPV